MTGKSIDVNDSKWAPGEPNNNDADGGQNCLQANWVEDQWDDVHCKEKKDFACEVPICFVYVVYVVFVVVISAARNYQLISLGHINLLFSSFTEFRRFIFLLSQRGLGN